MTEAKHNKTKKHSLLRQLSRKWIESILTWNHNCWASSRATKTSENSWPGIAINIRNKQTSSHFVFIHHRLPNTKHHKRTITFSYSNRQANANVSHTRRFNNT